MCGYTYDDDSRGLDTSKEITFSMFFSLTEMAIPLPGITANGLHCSIVMYQWLVCCVDITHWYDRFCVVQAQREPVIRHSLHLLLRFLKAQVSKNTKKYIIIQPIVPIAILGWFT